MRDGDEFELTIDDEGRFVWKATLSEGEPVEISGEYGLDGDIIELASPEDGTMVARVVSGGADAFQFILLGGPPSDEGLEFRRVAAE